jgi:hypothetical protein
MKLLRLLYEWWCMELRFRYVRAHAALKEAEYRRVDAQLGLNEFNNELPAIVQQVLKESHDMQASK